MLLKSALKTLRDVRFRGTRDMSRIVRNLREARVSERDGDGAGLVPLDRYVELILRTGAS